MQKVKLKNGLTVIYTERDTASVAVEVLVKAGSNDEQEDERGISHFIEHILFDGTKNRGSSQLISNEIEKIGGELNAYTSNERTCFFAKVLQKHFDVALDVLADLLQNPLFSAEDVNKEKKVVGKEIDLVNDEPRFYQWVLFQKSIFEKHQARFPTYGSKRVIAGLDRKKIKEYYKRYYRPNNIVVAITGKVEGWKKKVEKKFVFKRGKQVKRKKIAEPENRKNKFKKEKRKINSSYLVLGYKTVPRKHPDSYPLDAINAVLGRGQSGWMFDEIRSKRALAYEVGTQHACDQSYGFFAAYLSCSKKNLEMARLLILEQLRRLKTISAEELQEAKDYLEGDYLLEIEDTQKLADNLCFWEQVGDARLMEKYISRIKKVKVSDVQKAAEKYFKNYCLVIIEGK